MNIEDQVSKLSEQAYPLRGSRLTFVSRMLSADLTGRSRNAIDEAFISRETLRPSFPNRVQGLVNEEMNITCNFLRRMF